MTGNRALLTNFVEKFIGTVRFGNNDFAVIAGYGDVVIGSMPKRKFTIEVFHEISKSFQKESFSSSLNDNGQQNLKEVGVSSSNTQLFSNNVIPNVDEASTSDNVFNERLEDAYFDATLRDADWVSAMQDELDQLARRKTLFLNEILKEEVYVGQPSGFVSKQYPDHVYALDKALYGLKQAPRAWLQVNQFSNGIFINQSKYIIDILKRFEMENCDIIPTPMVKQAKLKLDLVEKPVDHTDYRSMIGSLMDVTSSRPDIMFSTCMCARYQANPNEHHVLAVKRIFRYLKGTSNLGLWYLKDSGFELTAYSDADHAGCHLDQKKVSGSDSKKDDMQLVPTLSLVVMKLSRVVKSDKNLMKRNQMIKLAAGSIRMADVRRLSAHAIKLRDMPGEDLSVGTPSSNILAKAKASQKRKASTSGATSSHVAKRTRSALAQSFGSTTCPGLFMGDDDDGSDDDDDACVEILLVTPLYSAIVIPSLGTRVGSLLLPLLKVLTPEGIMADDAAAPFICVSRPTPSSGLALSFRDVSRDAIHADFFPFSFGPYYATYPEGGIIRNYKFTRKEWNAPYQPNFRVLTKEVFKDLGVCKTVVDQFPTPKEMVQVETDSRLKGSEEKVASLTRLELQVSTLKKQVFGINDKLSSSGASFTKSKAKGKKRKKKIKSLTKSLDNLHAEVARLSTDLNRATVLEAEKDEEILHLKATPLKFSSFFQG
nr:hypothetical protein [Tanacetum cinerariifolium]